MTFTDPLFLLLFLLPFVNPCVSHVSLSLST